MTRPIPVVFHEHIFLMLLGARVSNVSAPSYLDIYQIHLPVR